MGVLGAAPREQNVLRTPPLAFTFSPFQEADAA